MSAVNKTDIRVYQQGTLWVEVLATQNDIDILAFNKIWFEIL